MKLYLSSYRVGNSKEVLKDWAKDHKTILVIPNALDAFEDSERKTNGISDKCNDLIELGFKTKILDLKNFFNKEKELNIFLKDYDSFYVLGGNTFVLRQAMKLSGFDEYLRKISSEPNYLYSGYSAGICVLAKDLHGIALADEPQKDPYGYGKIIWDGLGIIDYMPVPHYDTTEHPESFLMYDVVDYLKQNNLPYKTLKDGEVIVTDTNKQKVYNR